MANFDCSVLVNAPADKVFDFCTDLERWPGNVTAIKRVEKLTPGPVQVGTSFKETRVMFGKEATETMTFSLLDPPHGYVLKANTCGSDFEYTFRFKPEGAGTQVSVEFDCVPRSLFAKMIGRLMFSMMKGMMKKSLEQDLADVKRTVEAGSQTPVV